MWRNGFRIFLPAMGVLLIIIVLSALFGAKYHRQIKTVYSQALASMGIKPSTAAKHLKQPKQLNIDDYKGYFKQLKNKKSGGGYLPEMVVIPAAYFNMGCQVEPCPNKELPVQRVYVNAFEIATTEVTFEQWDRCIADGGCDFMPGDFDWGRGDYPLLNVSWNQFTQQFLPWINEHSPGGYRLPTEAEWEYAARAGLSAKRMTWGNEPPTCSVKDKTGARFGSKPYVAKAVPECPQISTMPVSSYTANAWGLYDIHGNVAEFTADCGPKFRIKKAKIQPSGGRGKDCGSRIRKGGAWTSPSSMLSVSLHRAYSANHAYDRVGFRLARTIN